MKNIYNLITYPILLFLSNLLFRLNNRLNIWDNKLNGGVVSKLFDYSRTDSADYFKEFMSEIMIFDNRKDFWDYSISKTRDQGIVLEFGVYKGNSINYMSKKLNNTNFFGFDSFEGLQEDWKGNYMRKGYFNVYGKLPKVNKNVKLFKGWFKNTLPVFLKSNEDEIKFIHIDCDTYESTKEIFNILGGKLKGGTVIIFDDFQGFPGWRKGEFKAFHEFILSQNLKYKYLSITNHQCSLTLI